MAVADTADQASWQVEGVQAWAQAWVEGVAALGPA